MLDEHHRRQEIVFRAADRLEAALIIQSRIRIVLATKALAAKRRDAEARGGLVSQRKKAAQTYMDPATLDSRYFIFKCQPPSDDEVLDLFDAIDVCNTGVIPRTHARAVFDRLLVDLFPGDPKVAFDRAAPVADDMLPPSALYFVVLRALAA
jgi:hypothetical protein